MKNTLVDYFIFKVELFNEEKKSLGSYNVAANTKMDALQRLKDNWPNEFEDAMHDFATVNMVNLGSFAEVVCIDDVLKIEKSN